MIKKLFNYFFPKGCSICGDDEVVSIIEHKVEIGDSIITVPTYLCPKCLKNRS